MLPRATGPPHLRLDTHSLRRRRIGNVTLGHKKRAGCATGSRLRSKEAGDPHGCLCTADTDALLLSRSTPTQASRSPAPALAPLTSTTNPALGAISQRLASSGSVNILKTWPLCCATTSR